MDIARITAEACFTVFAEPVTVAGAEVRGIVSNEMVTLDEYDQVTEPRLTLSVLVDEVPVLQKGTVISWRGKTYRVDTPVAGTDDPDVVTKVMLR